MGREFELKYRATPQVLQAIAGDTKGESRYYEMQTTYYDTAARELAERDCTLRRRMENAESICTLKFPVAGRGRGECELPRQEIAQAVEELCAMAKKPELFALIQKGIEPVCGARFQRQAITVQLTDCVVEIALDQGVLLGAGKEIPLCEVEVELKSGDPEEMMIYATLLAQRYGLKEEKRSKFHRASLLAKGELHG